jgi:hypothetical protein
VEDDPFVVAGSGVLDRYFLDAVWAIAQVYVEDGLAEELGKYWARLNTQVIHPDVHKDYFTTGTQLLSQIIALDAATRPESAIALFSSLRLALQELESSIADHAEWICSLTEDLIEESVKKHAKMIAFLMRELETAAEETDDFHAHTMHARAMFCLLDSTLEDSPNLALEDKLFRYVTNNLVELDVAAAVAAAEVELMIKFVPDWEKVKHCRDRVKELAGIGEYALNDKMIEMSAAADYELLVMASDVGHIQVAQSMFQNLLKLAEAHPGNFGVITRLSNAGLSMIIDYEERKDLSSADAAYRAFSPYAMPFAEDSEAANILISAAQALCYDLIYAGYESRAKSIYEEIRDIKADGDSAMRLEWLKSVFEPEIQ